MKNELKKQLLKELMQQMQVKMLELDEELLPEKKDEEVEVEMEPEEEKRKMEKLGMEEEVEKEDSISLLDNKKELADKMPLSLSLAALKKAKQKSSSHPKMPTPPVATPVAAVKEVEISVLKPKGGSKYKSKK